MREKRVLNTLPVKATKALPMAWDASPLSSWHLDKMKDEKNIKALK